MWFLCVFEPVSLRFCWVYLCGSGPGICVPVGCQEKARSLKRARGPFNPANPNKRSVGTQNDLDHHHHIHRPGISPSQSGYPLLFDIHSLSQPWNQLLESIFAASRNATGIGIILPFSDAITTTPPPSKSTSNITSKQTCPSTRPFLRHQDFHFSFKTSDQG